MAEYQQEFELKFSGTLACLSALADSDFIRAVTRAEGAWAHLETVYFDTPDNALAKAGLSLRQRTRDEGRRQTVKRVGAGGLVARGEWESVLTAASRFPAETGEAGIDACLADAAPKLRPVAEIDVDRWTCRFPYKSAVIELAVDLGRASAAGAGGKMIAAPLAEAELELVEGAPADLFAFARLLLHNAPLRLHARSKLETAKVFAAAAQFKIPRRKRLTILPTDSAAALLQRALIDIAERMIALQPLILDARAPEGVHQMRVELRRFRAIERVFRRAVCAASLHALADRAAGMARILGPARDWDVFLEETLPVAAKSGYALDGLAVIKAHALALRAKSWAGAIAYIGGPEFSGFVLDLLEAAHLRSWRDDAGPAMTAAALAEKTLDRARGKSLKTARRIDWSDPAALHPLRISLKKQRYRLQLFRPIYARAKRKPYMAAMSSLQDAFGAMNDAVVAQRLVNTAAEGGGEKAMRAAGFVSGFYAARADAAVKEIDAGWPAFENLKPFWRD